MAEQINEYDYDIDSRTLAMLENRTSPFSNDPFALLWEIFQECYPEKVVIAKWNPELETHGETAFDPSNTNFAEVHISSDLKIEDAAEIFAHELAHVAAGIDGEDGHGETWEREFDRMHKEYNRRVAHDQQTDSESGKL